MRVKSGVLSNVQSWIGQRKKSVIFRINLSLIGSHSLGLMAALGVLVGCVTGGVIVAFRLLIEGGQALILSDHQSYADLTPAVRVLLAVGGAAMLGWAFQRLGRESNTVGVVHVMERLAYHHGYLPLRNAVVQFVAGAVAIISGQSVGREGPAVHLGAAGGSWLGGRMALPNNGIQTLITCGIAASIAASFNTPLAGVIFAMEVVMMEYSISGFTPVILASVSGALVTWVVYGDDVAFLVPTLSLGTHWELGWVLLLALVVGTLAAALIELIQRLSRAGIKLQLWQRFCLAGLGTGLIASLVPEVMGIGYDTVSRALAGEYLIPGLVLLVVAKLTATALAIGSGLPGGIIGPTFVIGAAAGAAMGLLAEMVFPGATASPGFYAVLGMGAMMAATLQAPLAALTAMLELTGNHHIIMPGMLAVVGANLVAGQVFGKRSVFVALLRERGLDYAPDPVTRYLRSVVVTRVMDRRFAVVEDGCSPVELEQALETHPLWLVVRRDARPVAMLAATDVRRVLNEQDSSLGLDQLGLTGLPVAMLDRRASLQDALARIDEQQLQSLVVISGSARSQPEVEGILTRRQIEDQRDSLGPNGSPGA